jgi:ADP-heptose:LPS heptosyltransferase
LAIMKAPLRLPRYFVLVLLAECLHGSAAQRRRFIGRVTRSLAQPLGLYQAFCLALRGWQMGVGLVRRPPGSTGERRFPQWLQAIAGLENRDQLRSWIKHRYEGGPKIVVLGLGSVGDVLQITPVLRALRERFPAAEISLLHRSPAARMVLQGNRNVDSITIANSYQFEQIKKAVRDEGAADLVVEIENISYILTYTPAPLTLRHPDLRAVLPDSFFATATAAQELWKRHPPLLPHREVRFVWPWEWKDFQYLDVLGATGNLSIDRHSALDFFTEPADAIAIASFTPKKSYVTVQNGVDAAVKNWARVTGRQPTKLLPTATWEETVRLLQAGGLAVIQLGTEDDEPIGGVDTDLRGRTTLRQAAVILKDAVCHVGTEGGLVHLARAMNVRSVVAFGPTSTTFLGYPLNVNLVASNCTSCWWTTKDWYIYCPRGFVKPPCMKAYTADMIAGAVLNIFGDDNAEGQ